MSVTKQDMIDACGSPQVFAGHKSGSEAAVHAMRSIFDADDTDAVLLIDASNASNSLNRAAALHNISVLCPSIATYAINTYRRHLGSSSWAEKSYCQLKEPLKEILYAVSLQPLIAQLQTSSSAEQCWFADDATESGTLENVMRWWNELSSSGPALGYFPNAKKCWLITKPEKEEEARAVFGATAINITTERHKHLGAALGSRSYFEEYVGENVDDWVSQVIK